MTYEEHILAIRKSSYAIEDVPEGELDEAMCLVAVQRNGFVIREIPDILRTREVCLEACKKDSRAEYYIPERWRKTIEAYLKLIGKAE